MKKYISKIMLILSIIFGIGTIYEFMYCLTESVGRSGRITATLALLAVSGLFLGLYRIIDLLEDR